MNEIYNNQLIIGIVTAFICGILSFFALRMFLGRKEKREYLNRIRIANSEILNLVRPFVVDHKIPTTDIISAIIVSTAKKFDVKYEHLNNIEILSNDLINEILSNSFLSPTQKLEYCTLLTLFQEYESKEAKVDYITYEKESFSAAISYYFGFMTFAIVLMGALSFSNVIGNLFFLLSLMVVFGVSAFILIASLIPKWNKTKIQG